MNLIRKFIASAALFAASMSMVGAQDHTAVITFPAGSQADMIARTMSDVFARSTGQRMLIENVPGGETVIGTMHWRNKNLPIIFTSSGQMIWNMVQKSDLPYKDSDFNHVIYIGSTPAIWVTNADAPVKDLQDLVKSRNLRVGGYALSYNENFLAFQRKFNTSAVLVNYKGAPQVLNDVVGGHIEVGLIPVTPGLLSFVDQGKVRMLGSSYHKELVLGGHRVPSAPQVLGVQGFSGFVGIALHPDLPANQAEFLQKNLWLAMQDQSTQRVIKDLNILPDGNNDPRWISNHFNNLRANIAK